MLFSEKFNYDFFAHWASKWPNEVIYKNKSQRA